MERIQDLQPMLAELGDRDATLAALFHAIGRAVPRVARGGLLPDGDAVKLRRAVERARSGVGQLAAALGMLSGALDGRGSGDVDEEDIGLAMAIGTAPGRDEAKPLIPVNDEGLPLGRAAG